MKIAKGEWQKEDLVFLEDGKSVSCLVFSLPLVFPAMEKDGKIHYVKDPESLEKDFSAMFLCPVLVDNKYSLLVGDSTLLQNLMEIKQLCKLDRYRVHITKIGDSYDLSWGSEVDKEVYDLLSTYPFPDCKEALNNLFPKL